MGFLQFIVVGVAVLTATDTLAQSSGSPLSFAGLSDCATRSLVKQQRAAGQSGLLMKLLAARAAIAQRSAAIEVERTTLNHSDTVQIALFNDRVTEICADYTAYVTAYNAVISARNTYAATFNADCADRDSDPAMVASLPANLQAAWQAVTGGGEESAALSAEAMPPVPQPLAR